MDGKRRVGFVQFRGNQESLPIAIYIVGEDIARGNRLPPVVLEQRDREAGIEVVPATVTAIIFPSADK